MKKLLLLASMMFFGLQSMYAQPTHTESSDTVCSSGAGATNTVTMINPLFPSTDVTLDIWVKGDLDFTTEWVDVYSENGGFIGLAKTVAQCGPYEKTSFTVPVDSFAAWAADGIVTFDGVFTAATGFCAPDECIYIVANYTPVTGPNDAGVTGTAALQAICPGSNPVSVTIQNFGTNQITSVNIDWEMDGVPQTGVSHSNTLDTLGGSGASNASVTLGNYTFTVGQTYTLKAWTSLPNGVGDTTNLNDTLTATLALVNSPSGVSVSNVLTTTADVSWNVAAGTNYDIKYGPAGFDPNSAGTLISNVSSSPQTITGLNGSTGYDVYVRANCGAGAFSSWGGPAFFFTNCTITVAPWTEKFDNSTWISSGNNNNNVLNPCWSSNPDTSSTLAFKWIPRSTGPTSGNGPLSDYTGGNFLYCEASGSSAGQIAELVSPLIDVSGLNTPALYFMQHRYYTTTSPPAPMDVEVSNDGGTTWSNVYSISGNTQNSSGDPWELVFVNLGAYIGDTIQLKFIQTSVGCCGDAAIDSVVVDEAPLCPWPTNVAVTGLTSTSADFNWSDPTGSSWDIEWGPCGYTQGTGSFVSASTNPYTATGLAPNTCYDLYIRSNCSAAGNGTSIWIGPIEFRTACAPFTYPFSDNFDANPTNIVPNCWNEINHVAVGTPGVVETYSFATPNSPPNHIRLYNGSGNTAAGDEIILVSPEFSDMTVGDKRVTFFANVSFGTSSIIVGTLDKADTSGTFSPIDTVMLSTNTHQFFIVDVDLPAGYNGTDKFIGLKHGMDGTFQTIYIDDFSYTIVPACNPPLITSLGVSGTGTNSASIFWGSGSDGDETHIEWGSPGFTPGTGSNIGRDSVPGTQDMFNITGLSAQTTYEYYIADSCVSNGFSPWVGPISFTTQCNVIAAPYLDNFDGTSWVASGNNNGNMLDPCWNSSPDVSSALVFKWIPRSTAPTSGNGPLNDLTGGNFMYCEASGATAGQVAYLYSPLIDVSTLTAPALYFWQHRFYTSTTPPAPMDIEVTNDNGVTWTNVYNVSGNLQTSNSGPWEDEIVNLPQFVGDTIQIRFVQTSVGCCGDAAIDSVAIAEAPSCPDPGNVQAINVIDTAATIKWVGAIQAGTHEVWFGPQGFFQGTQTGGGTVVTVAGVDSLLLDTISDATCYEFLVRGICGPGDTSNWIGPITFCTQCRPFTMPYFQSFDTWPPNCWSVDLGTVPWVGYTAGTDGWANANFWNNGAPNNMIMQSPIVEVTQDARVRFTWSKLAATFNPNDELTVRVSISGTGVWDTLTNKRAGDGNFNDPTASNSAPGNGIEEWYNLDPATYTGQFIVVEFWANADFGPSCFINDFYIEQLPACPRPTGEMLLGAGANAANVTWTPGDTNATNWVIEYGMGDWISGTGTFVGAIGVTNDTATISSLMPNSNYCWRVAEICSNGTDTSLFTPLDCFNTACVPVGMPYYESFDAWTPTCWDVNLGTVPWVQYLAGTDGWADANFWGNSTGNMIMNSPAVIAGVRPQVRYTWSHLANTISYPEDELIVRVTVVGSGVWDTIMVRRTNLSNFDDPTASNTAPGTGIEDVIPLDTSYTGDTIMVQFWGNTDFGPNCYINDFFIEPVPSCPSPQGLDTANVLASTADLNWVAGTPGNTQFEVEYGVGLTFNQIGTGTRITVTGTTTSLTGLTPATNYCFFVREICAVGDTSNWAGSFCFNTQCQPIVNAPYSTNFEGITTGPGITQWENCWSGITVAGPYWQAQTGTGANQGSLNTGPFYDATTPGVAGGTYMVLETSTGTGQHEIRSPFIDVTSLASPELEYYYHMYGATINSLEVYAEDSQGNRTFLDSIVGQQMTAGSDPFLARTVSLSGVTPSIYRLVFVGIRGTSFTGDIAIDEVSVYDLGGCPLPSGLASSSVGCDSITVTWTSASGGSYLAYGPQGFMPPAGTATGIVTSPYTITGLTPGTAYDIYVADTCGSDTSQIVGPITVSTTGANVTAGFTFTFGSAGPASRTVFFDGSSSVGAVTYDWDFGDGNTGTGQNTSNIYTANGSYVVTLTVGSACGVDSIKDTVVVGGIGLPESLLNQTLQIFPNPAKSEVNLSFNRVSEEARIVLMDLSGKELMVREINNAGDFYSGRIDLSELSDGVYMLQISDGEVVVNRRLIKR